jgi:hypothetical protein
MCWTGVPLPRSWKDELGDGAARQGRARPRRRRARQIIMTGGSDERSVPSSIDVSPITDRLESVSQETGLGRVRVFRQWLDLLVAMFARDDDLHQDVLETVDEYVDDPTPVFQTYSEANGELIALTDDHMHDVLGDVYEEFGMASDHFAQHFTPHPAADLMAALSGTPEEGEKICDSSCGSGRMLIAAHRQARNDGVHATYYGKDKDSMCAKMTVVNFALFGLEGYVEQGDSIKMTTQQAWKTGIRPDGTAIREIDLTEDSEEQPDDDVFEQSSIGTFA